MPLKNLRYWLTVLSACSIGETLGDLVSHEWGFGYVWASLLFLALFAGLLWVERQFEASRKTRYWLTIAVMSTLGTTLADLFTRTLHLGYTWTSIVLIILFMGILILKQKQPTHTFQKNGLASDLPETDRYYWAAIMVASTLGTSLGDFVSNVLHLGFARGSLWLGGLLTAMLVIEELAVAPSPARYWSALILASTIGATTGDFLTKAEGLGFGFMSVIPIQVAILALLVYIE